MVEKPVETPVEEKPVVPEVKPDGTINSDDPDLRRLAIGTAAELGWSPPGAKPEVKVDKPVLIGDSDVPKPDGYDEWPVEVQDSYKKSVQAVMTTVKQETGSQSERMARIEATLTHDMAVRSAGSTLDDVYKPYLQKAVDSLVAANGGVPIPSADPGMVQIIQDRAIALAVKSGALSPRKTAVGETALGDTSANPFSQSTIDEVKAAFKKEGVTIDDKKATAWLREKGYVAV